MTDDTFFSFFNILVLYLINSDTCRHFIGVDVAH
jgi:hypothetical protein